MTGPACHMLYQPGISDPEVQLHLWVRCSSVAFACGDPKARLSFSSSLPTAEALAMNSQQADPLCRIFLFGPLTVQDCAGTVRTPRGQKVQALVAMLALAPRGARSRVWLRDKLWSNRQEEQARARSEEHTSELQSLTNLVCRL